MEQGEDIKLSQEYNKPYPKILIDHFESLAASEPLCDHNEITGEHLLNNQIETIPCLVEPFLQKVGLACLAGSSDTGKSSLLRQLAIACVMGYHDFLGFKINSTRRSVIYASSEDDEQAVSYLLRRQAGKIDPKELSRLRFIFDIDNLKNELDKRLTAWPADLVIIDCFADVYPGDLKDTQKIRTFLHAYQELAIKHNCLIIFLHHTGKRTDGLEPSKHNLLSGQGLEAKMRLVIELRQDVSNPNHRHLCIVKGNYLPVSYKKESFLLSFDEQSFYFENTGDRVPYELLIKQNEDAVKAKYLQAKELKDSGYSYEQIAKQVGYANKSSVARLFQRAEKKGWVA